MNARTRSIQARSLMLAALFAAACGAADERAETAAAAAAAPSQRDAGPLPAVLAARPDPLPRPIVHRLVSRIEAVSARESTVERARVADALRAIAAALEVVPDADRRAADAMRQAADQLVTGEGRPLSASEIARGALAGALRALVALEPPSRHRDDFARAVASLDAAVSAIDPQVQLEDQGGALSRGLRAAGDAVLAAVGSRPFLSVAAPRSVPVSASSFSECVGEVRSAARALAAARYPDERAAIATALGPLADCVWASPGPTRARDRLIGEIRFDAARIRSAAALERRLPDWVQGALEAALDAMSTLPVAARPDAHAWLAAARRATAAIDDRTGLAFQRARIQDAFRATVDALAVLSAATSGGAP